MKNERTLQVIFSIISGLLALAFLLLFKNAVYSFLIVSDIHVMKWQAIQLFSMVLIAVSFLIFVLAIHSIYGLASKRSKLKSWFMKITSIQCFLVFVEYLLISIATKTLNSTVSIIIMAVLIIATLVLFFISIRLQK